MPPRVFSTFSSPITLLLCAFTFLRSSRFAGMASFSVVLRSGSEAEAYVRHGIEGKDRATAGYHDDNNQQIFRCQSAIQMEVIPSTPSRRGMLIWRSMPYSRRIVACGVMRGSLEQVTFATDAQER